MASSINSTLTLESHTFEAQSIAVHKFGGSSLASVERLENVTSIISTFTNPDDLIVVSANGDVTDWLVDFIAGDTESLDKIDKFYRGIVSNALVEPYVWLSFFEGSISQLKSQSLSDDEVLAFGEVWSAKLLVELLNEKSIRSKFIDARELLATDSIDDYQGFDIDYFDNGFERAIYGNFGKRLVVTGFIAKDLCDNTITLGRNGSDYTASLLACFSEAESVNLWTDVPGIYTADPRLIKKAYPISRLTYDEATSLAAVGTNVLHQKTIGPLLKQRIPLNVRSSLQPTLKGTEVNYLGECSELVKSVALKPELVKLNLFETSESELEEIQHKLFEKHILTLGSDWNESEGEFSLLLESSLLEKAKRFLDSIGVCYDSRAENRAVIAIVGKNICDNEAFIKRLSLALADKVQFRVVTHHHKNSVYLVTQETETTRTLEKIYQASFDVAAELRLQNSPIANPSHVEQQTLNQVVI